MKKIVMTAALVACAAVVTAQTVTSANIVGYAKKTLTSGQFLMVAPQFQGTAAGTTLGAAFSGQNDQSVVYTWDGSGYTIYTYYAAAPGWFDSLFTPSDDVLIGEGDAVWLEDSAGGADAIMSGEVPSASSITNSLVAGFNMVANPYPVALQLGELPLASISDQDVIYVWDGSGYTIYTYYAAAPGWFDSLFTPADSVEIPVGNGFWLDSSAGGSLVLDKQY